MAEYSPMMKKYLETKEQYPDCILFYRLGDFYEMFFEDAKTASRELQLTLTGKYCGMEERAPMCGVPYHAADQYLTKLIEKGYKVAICEQVEDPAQAKGLVERKVIRVVTPGTNLSDQALQEKKNNYICCVCSVKDGYGLAAADISTGYFACTTLYEPRMLADEILKYEPAELLCSAAAAAQENITGLLRERLGIRESVLAERYFRFDDDREILLRHFGAASLTALGLEGAQAGTLCCGALLTYLEETQMQDLTCLRRIQLYNVGDYMQIDAATRRNLELTQTMREKRSRGSLLWILDHTKTAMGGRTLRAWVEQPLTDVSAIRARQDAVESFLRNLISREELREYLNAVYDLERLVGRITYGSAGPRDLIALKTSLEFLPAVRDLLTDFDAPLTASLRNEIDPLEDVFALIDRAIEDDPPVSAKDGGVIKTGYNAQIDEYRRASTDGKSWLTRIEEEEREKTGIKNLRIKFNKVFGYYLEVTNSWLNQVPDYFIRKQTLTNAERFITPELKDIEDKILGAQEKLASLENEIFREILREIAAQVDRIQKTAAALSRIDALISLAVTAEKHGYCRPEVTDEDILVIRGGRHPVVEATIKNELFIENDTEFTDAQHRIFLITGPNMAGKSTYMRQVALIVLLAQIGSFIPASSARIGICDRIFTRVGASDDLSSGQSTFMLEMSEVANILSNATPRSLVVLDEIGRGTSTYDGLSIAWAVTEYLSKTPSHCARTLFATHYHELTVLEDVLDNVVNYNIAVQESGKNVIFLRKIRRGSADRSYGIQVARLAGVPEEVTRRAEVILNEIIAQKGTLEAVDTGDAVFLSNVSQTDAAPVSAVPAVTQAEFAVLDRIRSLNPDTLSPLECMNLLYTLRSALLSEETEEEEK